MTAADRILLAAEAARIAAEAQVAALTARVAALTAERDLLRGQMRDIEATCDADGARHAEILAALIAGDLAAARLAAGVVATPSDGLAATRRFWSEDDLGGTCGDCGGPLEIVRPGKWQCPNEPHGYLPVHATHHATSHAAGLTCGAEWREVDVTCVWADVTCAACRARRPKGE